MDSANDRDKLPLAFGNTYISGAIECSRVLSGPVALLLCTPSLYICTVVTNGRVSLQKLEKYSCDG